MTSWRLYLSVCNVLIFTYGVYYIFKKTCTWNLYMMYEIYDVLCRIETFMMTCGRFCASNIIYVLDAQNVLHIMYVIQWYNHMMCFTCANTHVCFHVSNTSSCVLICKTQDITYILRWYLSMCHVYYISKYTHVNPIPYNTWGIVQPIAIGVSCLQSQNSSDYLGLSVSFVVFRWNKTV